MAYDQNELGQGILELFAERAAYPTYRSGFDVPVLGARHPFGPGHALGERVGTARLRAKVVSAILHKAQHRSLSSIAREYNIGITTVAQIAYGLTWTQIQGPRRKATSEQFYLLEAQ